MIIRLRGTAHEHAYGTSRGRRREVAILSHVWVLGSHDLLFGPVISRFLANSKHSILTTWICWIKHWTAGRAVFRTGVGRPRNDRPAPFWANNRRCCNLELWRLAIVEIIKLCERSRYRPLRSSRIKQRAENLGRKCVLRMRGRDRFDRPRY